MRNYNHENYGEYEDQDYNDTTDETMPEEYINEEIIEAANTQPNEEPISPEVNYEPEIIQPGQATNEPQAPGAAKAQLVQDFMSLAQAAQTGDPNAVFNALEAFSASQLSRFRNLSLVGGLLVYWAYRGKLSVMERTVMGLIGSGILISYGRNYLNTKNFIVSDNLQTATQDFLKTDKMSGYYRR